MTKGNFKVPMKVEVRAERITIKDLNQSPSLRCVPVTYQSEGEEYILRHYEQLVQGNMSINVVFTNTSIF